MDSTFLSHKIPGKYFLFTPYIPKLHWIFITTMLILFEFAKVLHAGSLREKKNENGQSVILPLQCARTLKFASCLLTFRFLSLFCHKDINVESAHSLNSGIAGVCVGGVCAYMFAHMRVCGGVHVRVCRTGIATSWHALSLLSLFKGFVKQQPYLTYTDKSLPSPPKLNWTHSGVIKSAGRRKILAVNHRGVW